MCIQLGNVSFDVSDTKNLFLYNASLSPNKLKSSFQSIQSPCFSFSLTLEQVLLQPSLTSKITAISPLPMCLDYRHKPCPTNLDHKHAYWLVRFFKFLFILCALVFCLHACLSESVRSPGTVTVNFEWACECWELNRGPHQCSQLLNHLSSANWLFIKSPLT